MLRASNGAAAAAGAGASMPGVGLAVPTHTNTYNSMPFKPPEIMGESGGKGLNLGVHSHLAGGSWGGSTSDKSVSPCKCECVGPSRRAGGVLLCRDGAGTTG